MDRVLGHVWWGCGSTAFSDWGRNASSNFEFQARGGGAGNHHFFTKEGVVVWWQLNQLGKHGQPASSTIWP